MKKALAAQGFEGGSRGDTEFNQWINAEKKALAQVMGEALIPEKKSLYLAQKAMNYRNTEKVMEAFATINVSPITISKRHDVKKLENLYGYLG